jgi:hypothetical protein
MQTWSGPERAREEAERMGATARVSAQAEAGTSGSAGMGAEGAGGAVGGARASGSAGVEQQRVQVRVALALVRAA